MSRALFLVFFLALSGALSAKTAFSLREWMQQDPESKLMLITALIKQHADRKIIHRLPPDYYVRELDSLAQNTIANGNGATLDDQPVGVSFETIAVMDCDWDNGQDRLKFAQELMGPEFFAQFKQDYPDKYRKLAAGCH